MRPTSRPDGRRSCGRGSRARTSLRRARQAARRCRRWWGGRRSCGGACRPAGSRRKEDAIGAQLFVTDIGIGVPRDAQAGLTAADVFCSTSSPAGAEPRRRRSSGRRGFELQIDSRRLAELNLLRLFLIARVRRLRWMRRPWFAPLVRRQDRRGSWIARCGSTAARCLGGPGSAVRDRPARSPKGRHGQLQLDRIGRPAGVAQAAARQEIGPARPGPAAAARRTRRRDRRRESAKSASAFSCVLRQPRPVADPESARQR